MTLDGFYRIEIDSPIWFGTGTTIVEGGRLYGSDSAYMWRGTVTLEDGRLIGSVEVRQHGAAPDGNVFGNTRRGYRALVDGALRGDAADARGTIEGTLRADVPGSPAVPFRLTRLCDLP